MRLWSALLFALLVGAGGARADIPSECLGPVTQAFHTGQTDRYPHGALGDPLEWTGLSVFLELTMPCRAGSARINVTLPDSLVFEYPRDPILADLDGDDAPEIITVESHQTKGARLAIYGVQGTQVSRIAETPFIGRRFRWLAPLGAADLDGDGHVEIAYIDRPHLAKTLRLWRFVDGALVPVGQQAGLTNHRIGEPQISGGIRDCGAGPEIITVDGQWTQVIATVFDGQDTRSRPLGRFNGLDDLKSALRCR